MATKTSSTHSSAGAGRSDGATIIGASVQVRGTLTGDEDLQVFGRLEGRVDLERTLVVEDGGIVKADVSVKTALISGVVVGNVTATESVQLLRGARMVGDIAAPRVIIAEGASYRGSVDMGDLEAAPARRSVAERTTLAPARREPDQRAPGTSASPASAASAKAKPAASAPPVRSAAPAAAITIPSRPADPRPADPRPVEKVTEPPRPAPAAPRPASPPAPSAPLEAPAAKGLPQKASKTRVIVKRK